MNIFVESIYVIIKKLLVFFCRINIRPISNIGAGNGFCGIDLNGVVIISLHICSMWETICDALFWNLVPEPPTLPPPWNFSQSPNPTLPRTPPPPGKWKTLTFFPEFRSELTQNTAPTPPVAVEVCGDCIPQGYHLV